MFFCVNLPVVREFDVLLPPLHPPPPPHGHLVLQREEEAALRELEAEGPGRNIDQCVCLIFYPLGGGMDGGNFFCKVWPKMHGKTKAFFGGEGAVYIFEIDGGLCTALGDVLLHKLQMAGALISLGVHQRCGYFWNQGIKLHHIGGCHF